MEVYLSEHIAPSAYARLARHFEIVDNFDHPERLAAMVIRRAVVPRSVIARAPNLKVIAMHGVSRDTIDTAAAAEFGVPVPNVPGLGAPAVAELAVADLLALNRQLKFVNNGLCAGRFDHFGAEEFVCHEMTGRTLGLVGTATLPTAWRTFCAQHLMCASCAGIRAARPPNVPRGATNRSGPCRSFSVARTS